MIESTQNQLKDSYFSHELKNNAIMININVMNTIISNGYLFQKIFMIDF